MVKDILHLDIGSAATTAKAWSFSDGGFRSMGSAVVPSPRASGSADLGLGAHIAHSVLKGKLAQSGLKFDPHDILVTLSAAGEPRVACAGVVRGISGESARRAALAAGATVTDLITVDDGRDDYQRVSDLRRQAISMVVMAGGVDEEIMSSGRHQLLSVAKVIADGLPEIGGRKVPVVYAASQEGRAEVMRILGDSTEIIWADNVRARLEEEHLESARHAVLSVFSDAVRHDPRFAGLGRFGSSPVYPTGYASGMTVERMARSAGENVMAISLGGDSVEVFSVIKGVFTRTVTPVDRVQAKGVLRWLPSVALARDVSDALANWKTNPGALPRTWEELAVFLAFQKEAVREALEDHSKSAIELRGVHRQRQIGETFEVRVRGGETLVKMERIASICVTGFLAGILPPSALVSIVLDTALPCGVTKLYADRFGLMQAYGLFVGEDPDFHIEAGLQPLCVVISPGRDEERVRDRWAFLAEGNSLQPLPVEQDEISEVTLESRGQVEFELHPASKVDLGDGEGRKFRAKVRGFTTAYVDGRPRTTWAFERYQHNQRWYRSLGVFPPDVLAAWGRGRD